MIRLLKVFPELKESEDERIKKWLIGYFRQYKKDGIEKYANGLKVESIIAWLEKQGEQKIQAKSAIEIWKDMRLEVYQQASGNRHEPNYSDDTTKMFSLNDIDEIMEKMSEQKKDFRERYDEITAFEWFNQTDEEMSISERNGSLAKRK